MAEKVIRVRVNGRVYEQSVPPRKTLLDFLREDLALTGTHAGCEHGVCGCCNVLLSDGDGAPGVLVRSCLLFAVQVDGREVTTIEGLEHLGESAATGGGYPLAGAVGRPGELASAAVLHPLQEAFCEHHALQCGYCTPGMILASYALLQENDDPTEAEVRAAIAGNLCRCTGYVQIVDAVLDAAARLRAQQRETAPLPAHPTGMATG